MTDADVDGAHIRTLLLTLLARKLKPLFDEGRIFIAQPPLYKIKKGKTEKYISNDEELNMFLSTSFFDNKHIISEKNKINSQESSNVLINYSRIPSILKNISKSKDKIVLKAMSFIPTLSTKNKNNTSELDKYIQYLADAVRLLSPINITYKFSYEILEHESFQINIIKKVNGIVDPTILPINKKFFSSQTYINLMSINLYKFHSKQLSLVGDSLNESFSSMYELCEYALETSRKSISLQRYKGLGEMNPSQLAETTMNPKTRSLLQVAQIPDDDYTVFDTLMGEDVEKRREFIVASSNMLDHVDV
jgi:DNA gyrase subunit B